MSRYLLERVPGRASFMTMLAVALTACAPMPPGADQVAAAPSVAQSAPQAASAPVASNPAPPVKPAADGPLPVPPKLLALTQPAGQLRLKFSADNQSYWPLSQYYETQRNEAYCSVASSVMVLNALGIQRPASSQYPDFPFYSQTDFFNGMDAQVANAAQVSKEGMTLDQLATALQTFPVNVTRYHATDLTLPQFRRLIRDTTRHADRFALLNFHRTEIGEVGGGHWSPLAAYDAHSDSALLLDVARYKYPAVWVPVARLYAGAQAVDNVSNLSRGLVVVTRRPN